MNYRVRSGSGVGIKRVVERQCGHGQLLGPTLHNQKGQKENRESRTEETLFWTHRIKVIGPVHSACIAGSSTRM